MEQEKSLDIEDMQKLDKWFNDMSTNERIDFILKYKASNKFDHSLTGKRKQLHAYIFGFNGCFYPVTKLNGFDSEVSTLWQTLKIMKSEGLIEDAFNENGNLKPMIIPAAIGYKALQCGGYIKYLRKENNWTFIQKCNMAATILLTGVIIYLQAVNHSEINVINERLHKFEYLVDSLNIKYNTTLRRLEERIKIQKTSQNNTKK